MTLSHSFAGPARQFTNAGHAALPMATRSPCRDERWPRIAEALVRIRAEARCSVRIVDADCGAGSLLLHAVRHARAIGFTAIEARGIDGAPALIGRARAAAAGRADFATGVTFEAADLMTALAEEQEFPADIILWHGRQAGIDQPGIARAIAAAGRLVITDGAIANGIAA